MRRVVWSLAFVTFLFLLGVAGLAGWRFYHQLEHEVVTRFDSHRWQVPSKVYAKPFLLYPGREVVPQALLDQLTRLGYQHVSGAVSARGEYAYNDKKGELQLFLHEFPSISRRNFAQRVHLVLQAGKVERMIDLDNDAELRAVTLDPEVITKLYGEAWEERRIVKLYDLPSLLVKALLAAEDHRFFEHYGIDLWRIMGAFRANWGAGATIQGGSTLTQQLVKNFFLSPERTLGRKLIEICMAVIVENHYSKLQIIENYLNEIYLGQHGPKGIFGVWEASRLYFGKEPRDLDMSEMALLVGIIKAPNRFTPTRHLERAIQRRNYVLRRMRELYPSEVPEEDYRIALQDEIILREPSSGQNNTAPYFVDAIRKELEEKYSRKMLTTEGFHIFTSLDMQLQRIAQEVVRSGLKNLEKKYPRLQREDPQQRLQACLIALQPQTGRIKAMVGGRDYRVSQFNRVTQASRQPGSIFKPVVYLTALTGQGKQKYSPASTIRDAHFTWPFGNQRWSPENYRHKYRGSVTLRHALALSLNAATARLARSVGLKPIRDMAWNLGFRSPLPLYPSLSLGAAEVTPFEVAVAYGTLANQGIRVDPRTIAGIVNLEGETVERKHLEFKQVVTPQQAYDITNMLEDVITQGTARRARQQGFTRPAAGKTGTTNDFGDAWFAGYTPDLVAVVWVGFDRRESLNLAGGQAALPIWTDFMKQALAGQPDIAFVRPAQDPPTPLRRFAPYTPYVPYGNQTAPNDPVQRGSTAAQPSNFATTTPAAALTPFSFETKRD